MKNDTGKLEVAVLMPVFTVSGEEVANLMPVSTVSGEIEGTY